MKVYIIHTSTNFFDGDNSTIEGVFSTMDKAMESIYKIMEDKIEYFIEYQKEYIEESGEEFNLDAFFDKFKMKYTTPTWIFDTDDEGTLYEFRIEEKDVQ